VVPRRNRQHTHKSKPRKTGQKNECSLRHVADDLKIISDDFAPLFHTRNASGKHAPNYLKGLLSNLPDKNMERMAESIDGSTQQELQQFISDSPWQDRPVWDAVAHRVDAKLGGQEDSMLVGDESCFAKQGGNSVGVARQHNGRLGKTDNCQVGVYTSLVLGARCALVGCRLFLPDEWADDKGRCLKVGVPQAHIRQRTKIGLMRDLFDQAIEQGLRFALVGFDSFYGRDQALLAYIASKGRIFVADIPRDTRVWKSKPTGKERPKAVGASGGVRVDKLPATPLRSVHVRKSENGPVRVRACATQVWTWPPEATAPMRCTLLRSEHSDGTRKFTLINAPEGAALVKLVRWQGQRFFVEQSFKNGKSNAGMADYQVRKWRGWHHHMAMVGVALLFALEQRERLAETLPQLSVADITELLHWQFVMRPSREELIERIMQRHRRRSNATASKYRVDRRNQRCTT
jgi:SRSO17 transposase